MRHDVCSPLVPIRLGPPPERSLRHLDGLGAAIDMIRYLPAHGRLPLTVSVPLIMNALKENRIHFALTEDEKPWGIAVWHWINPTTHIKWLLQAPPIEVMISSSEEANAIEEKYLWFSLLITPFCASLVMLEQLQERLPLVHKAWAITPYSQFGSSQARPIW